MLIQLIIAVCCYVPKMIFQQYEPPTPPSESAQIPRESFKVAMLRLFSNRIYVILFLSPSNTSRQNHCKNKQMQQGRLKSRKLSMKKKDKMNNQIKDYNCNYCYLQIRLAKHSYDFFFEMLVISLQQPFSILKQLQNNSLYYLLRLAVQSLFSRLMK